MPESSPETVWVVVAVCSGIPVSADLCMSREAAQQRELELRDGMNDHEDETGVFEITEDGASTEIVFRENRAHLARGC